MRTVYFDLFGKKMKMHIDIDTNDEERVRVRLMNAINLNLTIDKITKLEKKKTSNQTDITIEELKSFFGMK